MGKTSKMVLCGMKGIGKTSILQQVIYGNTDQIYPTIEDIYVANIETDRGVREKIRFYDTAGLEDLQTSDRTTVQQLPRHYLSLADGYVLVYSCTKPESLDILVSLKKDVEKNKDKKEITFIVIGNQINKESFDSNVISKAMQWCNRERIRHFVCCVQERSSLYEPFIYLASKLNPPPSKSSFTQLTMGRKVLNKD